MIADSADVSQYAVVAESAKIWHLAQVRETAFLGNHVIIGRGAYIGVGVHVGDNSKIQNYAQIFEPACIGMGVFIGPAAVLTNDRWPRAVSPDGEQKTADQWHSVGVNVGDGASIGAGAICVAPLEIGPWAMVAAGSVVTSDVLSHALVAGVPARQIGWVGKVGVKLVPHQTNSNRMVCPESGSQFEEVNGHLIELAP